MPKKYKTHPVGVYDQSDKVFIVTLRWAATVIVGAILTGAVGGAFALGAVANVDHFAISSNAKAIEELETGLDTKANQTYVDKGFEGINKILDRIESNQKDMQADIKLLLRN